MIGSRKSIKHQEKPPDRHNSLSNCPIFTTCAVGVSIITCSLLFYDPDKTDVESHENFKKIQLILVAFLISIFTLLLVILIGHLLEKDENGNSKLYSMPLVERLFVKKEAKIERSIKVAFREGKSVKRRNSVFGFIKYIPMFIFLSDGNQLA